MSDTAQGPGWWQASDGRWYPPQEMQAPPPPPAAPPTAGKATATLVLGIISFVVCPILPAIAALIVGAQADRQIRESGGRLGGEGMVKAGRILAIVHLALSVVMIPLLLAIAVPTFLGAQERAQDRAAQSELRNAFTAERVHHIDHEQWTGDLTALATIEPSLTYEEGTTPRDPGVVYVVVDGEIIGLSAMSESGTCFYLSAAASSDSVAYAEDEGCGAADAQQYVSGWG